MHVMLVVVATPGVVVEATFDHSERPTGVDVRGSLQEEPGDETGQFGDGVGVVAILVVGVELGVLLLQELGALGLHLLLGALQLALQLAVLEVGRLQVAPHAFELHLQGGDSAGQVGDLTGQGARGRRQGTGVVVVPTGQPGGAAGEALPAEGAPLLVHPGGGQHHLTGELVVGQVGAAHPHPTPRALHQGVAARGQVCGQVVQFDHCPTAAVDVLTLDVHVVDQVPQGVDGAHTVGAHRPPTLWAGGRAGRPTQPHVQALVTEGVAARGQHGVLQYTATDATYQVRVH